MNKFSGKDFIISLKDFNMVEEVGMPKVDLGWYVFIVDYSGNGEYEWGLGGYHQEEQTFYCNLSMGGMVTDADSVVAWRAWMDAYDDDSDQLIYHGCANDVSLVDRQNE